MIEKGKDRATPKDTFHHSRKHSYEEYGSSGDEDAQMEYFIRRQEEKEEIERQKKRNMAKLKRSLSVRRKMTAQNLKANKDVSPQIEKTGSPSSSL